jgi:hypothetical protein
MSGKRPSEQPITPSQKFTMEMFVSAVLGDLLSRSVSFIIDRCYYRQHMGVEEYLPWMRRVLLRIQTTVEEAGGGGISQTKRPSYAPAAPDAERSAVQRLLPA